MDVNFMKINLDINFILLIFVMDLKITFKNNNYEHTRNF